MVILLLTALTGCRSLFNRQQARDLETNEIVINLVPKHPDFPEFPSLTWFNENGHQCISNEDALKVLDYWENTIPQYLFEVEKYEKSIATILGAL